MAKQRFSLEETMTDAIRNIEDAKKELPTQVNEHASLTEEILEEPEEQLPKLLKLKKKIVKSTTDSILRNVPLTEEQLDKLEKIKKALNKSRDKQKKEPFVSVADILNVAVQELLDKYYK